MQSPSARENPTSSSLPTRRDAMKAVSVVVGGALAGVGGGVASARNEGHPDGGKAFLYTR